MEINLGAFDEEVLCGKKVEDGAWTDGVGRHVRYHIFCENEIPGLTDGFEGDKWLLGREDGERFRGKVRDLVKGTDEGGKEGDE